jgi:hypothetical protein
VVSKYRRFSHVMTIGLQTACVDLLATITKLKQGMNSRWD